MAQCYDNFKVAWMAGGQLHSSMHATEAQARAAERTVPQPRMVMQLTGTSGTGQYAWKLLPGPWANAVNYWEWIAAAIVVVIAFAIAYIKD